MIVNLVWWHSTTILADVWNVTNISSILQNIVPEKQHVCLWMLCFIAWCTALLQRSTTFWASASSARAMSEGTEESTSAPSWRAEPWQQTAASSPETCCCRCVRTADGEQAKAHGGSLEVCARWQFSMFFRWTTSTLRTWATTTPSECSGTSCTNQGEAPRVVWTCAHTAVTLWCSAQQQSRNRPPEADSASFQSNSAAVLFTVRPQTTQSPEQSAFMFLPGAKRVWGFAATGSVFCCLCSGWHLSLSLIQHLGSLLMGPNVVDARHLVAAPVPATTHFVGSCRHDALPLCRARLERWWTPGWGREPWLALLNNLMERYNPLRTKVLCQFKRLLCKHGWLYNNISAPLNFILSSWLCLFPAPLLWLSPSAGTRTLAAALLCLGVSTSLLLSSIPMQLQAKSYDEKTNSHCTCCPKSCRRTHPTHWPRCLGVPHSGHDRGVPAVWHEPLHEHRHLHQLLHQQLHPWDWAWVASLQSKSRPEWLFIFVNMNNFTRLCNTRKHRVKHSKD